MKKYAMLALAAMFMMSVATVAQEQAPSKDWKEGKRELKKGDKPMITPEKRAEKLAKTLDLNAAQKADVQALFEKQDAKRHQEMEKFEKMRAEMKAKFEAERKANDEALAKIIGQEKFQKFQTIRAERQDKMKDKMKHMRKGHENQAPENDDDNK